MMNNFNGEVPQVLGNDAFKTETKPYDYIVIGAGIAGCVTAGGLAAQGKRVLLIEKARGTGGRLSSKRVSIGDSEHTFDLGAPSFELSHPDFKHFLTSVSGVRDLATHTSVSEVSSMAYMEGRNSQLARRALGDSATRFGWRVEKARYESDQSIWEVSIAQGDERVTERALALIVATPPKQAAALLGESHPFYASLDKVNHAVQWVVMLAVRHSALLRSQLVSFGEVGSSLSSSIDSLSLNSIKRGRSAPEGMDCVLLHADESWSSDHRNDAKEDVLKLLQNDLADLLGVSPLTLCNSICFNHIHRWLYAKPIESSRLKGEHWHEDRQRLWVCGDYYSVGSTHGVESAYLSGISVLTQVLSQK